MSELWLLEIPCFNHVLTRVDHLMFREDDNNWPVPDQAGKQELEVVTGDEHISFNVSAKQ